MTPTPQPCKVTPMTKVEKMSRTRIEQLARVGIPEEDIRTDCDVCGHKDSRTILNHSYPYAFKGYLCRKCKDVFNFKYQQETHLLQSRSNDFLMRSEAQAFDNTGLGRPLPEPDPEEDNEHRQLASVLLNLTKMQTLTADFNRRLLLDIEDFGRNNPRFTEEAQAHLGALPTA